MTARQFLTLLDTLGDEQFGDWRAFDVMPQRDPITGRKLAANVSLSEAVARRVIAWKTGTDETGIKNVAGFIPGGADPHRFYYVMFVATGRSPRQGDPGVTKDEPGIRQGERVVERFVAWAGQVTAAEIASER